MYLVNKLLIIFSIIIFFSCINNNLAKNIKNTPPKNSNKSILKSKKQNNNSFFKKFETKFTALSCIYSLLAITYGQPTINMSTGIICNFEFNDLDFAPITLNTILASSLQISQNNNITFAYTTSNAMTSASQVNYLVCSDNLCNNKIIKKISGGSISNLSFSPILALNEIDDPQIAFIQADFLDINAVYAICEDLKCEDFSIKRISNIFEDFILIFGFNLLNSIDPIFAFGQNTTLAIQYIRCLDQFCNSQINQEVGPSNTDLSLITSLTINNLNPVMVYSSINTGTDDTTFISICQDSSCNQFINILLVNDFTISVVKINNGNPVILSHCQNLGTLELFSCLDSLCSSITTTFIDNTTIAIIDFVIDSNANPVIVYQGILNLYLVICYDTLCNIKQRTIIETNLGSPLNFQVGVSIKLRGGGPVITYYNYNTEQYRLAVCVPDTESPTPSPSNFPSTSPTNSPTSTPTIHTLNPSNSPTNPTKAPTNATFSPTLAPTRFSGLRPWDITAISIISGLLVVGIVCCFFYFLIKLIRYLRTERGNVVFYDYNIGL